MDKKEVIKISFNLLNELLLLIFGIYGIIINCFTSGFMGNG